MEVNDANALLATAAHIDGEFANSSSETRTQNSAEYSLSFVRQLGDVGAMATIILLAVLFTLVIVTVTPWPGLFMNAPVSSRCCESWGLNLPP